MEGQKKSAPKQPARSGSAGSSGSRPAAGTSGVRSAAGTRTAPAKPMRRVGNYKANLNSRIAAAAIDALVGFILGLVFILTGLPSLGVLIALAYLLLKDGLPLAPLEYKSVGKKLMGLHVEDDKTGEERIAPVTSVRRNVTAYGGLLLLVLILLLAGEWWPIGIVLAVVPAILEIVLIVRDENGVRAGDRLAGTRVLD